MTAVASHKSTTQGSGSLASVSQFQVRVTTAEDGTHLTLEETNRPRGYTREMHTLSPRRVRTIMSALTDALHSSGHSAGIINRARDDEPLLLNDAAGVRLALACALTEGVTKPGRPTALLQALARMIDEECFYWYAHTHFGAYQKRQRTIRAMRIFLAGDTK